MELKSRAREARRAVQVGETAAPQKHLELAQHGGEHTPSGAHHTGNLMLCRTLMYWAWGGGGAYNVA